MSCQDNIGQSVQAGEELDPSGQSFSIREVQDFNAPQEIFGGERIITDNHTEALKLALTRGQHKIKALIPYDSREALSIDNKMRKLDIDGEFKRVYFHKVDIRPVEEGKALLTAVVHVLDNPIPLIPIVWGASIVAGATAGYFFIDKVESFSNSIGGMISIGIALVVAYFTIFE